jgi:hypothetical protein
VVEEQFRNQEDDPNHAERDTDNQRINQFHDADSTRAASTSWATRKHPPVHDVGADSRRRPD